MSARHEQINRATAEAAAMLRKIPASVLRSMWARERAQGCVAIIVSNRPGVLACFGLPAINDYVAFPVLDLRVDPAAVRRARERGGLWHELGEEAPLVCFTRSGTSFARTDATAGAGQVWRLVVREGGDHGSN